MDRFEIVCCMDSKSTNIYSMAELAAFAMLDGLNLLGVPDDKLFVDLIDHKRNVYKHIVGNNYSDIVLTEWRVYNAE